MMQLDTQAMLDFQAHALSEYPFEAVGFIVGGEYKRVVNRAGGPQEHDSKNEDCQCKMCSFRVSKEDQLAAGKIEAVLHSHTNHRNWPSLADQLGQQAMMIPWAIADIRNGGVHEIFWFGDQCDPAPLVGRQFKHAVWDCYSLIRDYFREKGIVWADQPRRWEWWKHGDNFYLDQWEWAGFEVIDRSEVREGDCCLMKIMSPVPNHAGVYLGNDVLLHHLQFRASGRQPMNMWAKKVDLWVRHKDFKGEEA